jgi:multidrug efflux pump subunit AcrA (membrane-fusion protein)
VEIRLPINNSDLQYVDLPEQFRDRALSESALDVSFKSAANDAQVWQGKVIRTEGSIDSNSQQLYVVAQIDDPFAQSSIQGNGTLGLKIGQYLSAKIQGKLITNALIIPNSAIYQASYVFIEQDQILQRKEISIAWQNAQYALVSTGLSFNQHLVLTPLGQVSSGTKVAILGENSRPSSNSSMLSKQQKHQGSKQ